MKVLVDEMYPATVAEALRAAGIEATTVANLRLAGATDPELFGAAVAGGYAVLTENVGDFARIAAEHSTAGGHHNGLLDARVLPRTQSGGACFVLPHTPEDCPGMGVLTRPLYQLAIAGSRLDRMPTRRAS